MITFNIIGTGKVGKTIGKLMVQHNLAKLLGVLNRNLLHSEDALQFIGEGKAYSTLSDLPPADLFLITTADEAIESTCENLSKSITPQSIVIHCSGSLSSDVLLSAKQQHCYIASIHPMHSFNDPKHSVKHYTGTYCAVEGDPEALHLIIPLLQNIGSITYTINKDKKSLYHAGGVFASNYLMTIAEEASSCFQKAGIEKETAIKITLHLMQNTLSNLEKTRSTAEALTGPIQRGESKIIENHLAAFDDDVQKKLYTILGQQTLELTQHAESKRKILQNILDAASIN